MVNGYMNPYMNPYGQQYQTYQQQQLPQQQVVKVNGENGARAYPMGANSSAWLLDESGLISWLVITDGASYKTITPYDVTPHKTVQQQDFSSLESRISKLEGIVNEFTANSSATTRKNSGKSANASVAPTNPEC